MYTLPILSEELANLAEKMLPRFSDRNKVLEILIRFNYEKYKGKRMIGVEYSEYQHIRVVFWRPGSYMLVGYNFETLVENIFDRYIISAHHDSAWKYDGLKFFHQILEEPKSWDIIETEIIEVINPEAGNEFTFTRPVAA
jgi:hypothetical protein